ncbi:unnamed protein product [Aureobasidium vineae]|uniref:Uncharacterized protein n=1 Tax=Aureobasidium vineae TaxID=2773715 RepID=A0A9N8JA48_9PEZI|nr:unnamed protein product [Aureobasidium vineae]
MQESRQPSFNILKAAYNILGCGTRLFAYFRDQESERKTQMFEWEKRLAYVGEEVDTEDDDISADERVVQLARSCGVAR